MENHSVITRGPFSEAFLHRALRMTALLCLIGSLVCLTYFGPWPALAFLSGGVWTLINMRFLAALVRSALKPGEIDKMQVFGLALIKFPLLYVTGYFLVTFERFPILFLLAGLSLFLVVVVLKALGRAVAKVDEPSKDIQRESVLN